ncbi:MAG: TRAP transporter fused permease subunit [Cardiobacteriaceae bacterium]|nr:TRAP transporter fused permease subunit [Cardiobacteriaceae bacterium]
MSYFHEMFRDLYRDAKALPSVLYQRDEASLHLSSKPLLWLNLLALGLAIFHIVNAFYPLVSDIQRNMIHLAGFSLLGVFYYPLLKQEPKRSFWLDFALGILLVASILYFMMMEDTMYRRQSAQQDIFGWVDWLWALVLLFGTLELTRRTTGWIIPLLILLAISYITWLGPMLGGVFNFKGLSWETVAFREIFGDDALFGSIATISSTYVFLFIVFGAFLIRSGAGDFVVDLARGVAGRFVGGAGWVAVIASGLTGTISGSAVANTASTGVITIPLMKRSGFPPKFAAAVEAAASTGGQIMPPIMGAGAFVMATYTQIPYEHIVAVSFLPALLYFFSVAVFVRIEAKKQGLQPIIDSESKPLKQALKDQGASFIVPIILLTYLMIDGKTPTYAACAGIIAIVVSSWFTKTRMGITACLEALIAATRSMIMMGILLCAVGLMVNVITTTGIGTAFSLMIQQWSSGNLLVALILVALASLVLGMGLPVTAAYIVLATLSAPALTGMMLDVQLVDVIAAGKLPESTHMLLMLADPSLVERVAAPMSSAEAQQLLNSLPEAIRLNLREQAIDPTVAQTALLSAHMIIFWLSQDSNVTPPVCLAAFTAAAIAKTPPMSTGFESWKLAKGLYVLPVLFAYTPFLSGDFQSALVIFGFALVAVYALAAGLQGGMERSIGWGLRSMALLSGALLLYPHDSIQLIGLGLFAFTFALHRKVSF